jgi:hypothetical protein
MIVWSSAPMTITSIRPDRTRMIGERGRPATGGTVPTVDHDCPHPLPSPVYHTPSGYRDFLSGAAHSISNLVGLALPSLGLGRMARGNALGQPRMLPGQTTQARPPSRLSLSSGPCCGSRRRRRRCAVVRQITDAHGVSRKAAGWLMLRPYRPILVDRTTAPYRKATAHRRSRNESLGPPSGAGWVLPQHTNPNRS